MEYTTEEIIGCLENRKLWYQKAIDMKVGKVAYEDSFDFPDGSIETWVGSVRELRNTIKMLKRCGKPKKVNSYETMYDRIRNFSEEDMVEFVYWVYIKGNYDGYCHWQDYSTKGFKDDFTGRLLRLDANRLIPNGVNDLWEHFDFTPLTERQKARHLAFARDGRRYRRTYQLFKTEEEAKALCEKENSDYYIRTKFPAEYFEIGNDRHDGYKYVALFLTR